MCVLWLRHVKAGSAVYESVGAAGQGADAVLTGSLAVAVTAAKAALEVAQKAADNFLKGVIAAALAAAKAAFAAAQVQHLP